MSTAPLSPNTVELVHSLFMPLFCLKVTDIDSQRMTLRVGQGKGKGQKDRYAMLSPFPAGKASLCSTHVSIFRQCSGTSVRWCTRANRSKDPAEMVPCYTVPIYSTTFSV